MNSMIHYVNENKSIFVFLIFLLIVILWKLFSIENFSIEGIENVTSIDDTMDMYVTNIGLSKDILIRFKTNINGQEYFLATKIGCANTNNDCINRLILIDDATVTKQTKDYINNVSDKQKICNFEETLKDKRKGIDIGNVCFTEHPSCIIDSRRYTDFIIKKVITSSNDVSYNIIGYTKENMELMGKPTPYFLSMIQNTMNLTSPPYPCVSSFSGGTANENAQVKFDISRIGKNGETSLKTLVRIRFKVGNVQNGKIFYLGKCKDNVNTCNIDNIKNMDTCLYDDYTNNNVLQFEPIITIY